MKSIALILPLLFVSTAEAGRPNILVVLADDMGFSDAGCYGGEIATPTLDDLARNGLRFTQFYNTARCWPSRAALLTGYYAQQVRRDALPNVAGGAQGVRPSWAKLLPDRLRPLGYRSYHSGKWHVDGQPLANGFDHSYDLEDHDRHFYPKRHLEDGRPLPPVEPTDGYYTSAAMADHAIKCLKEHQDKYADRPFFQYLAFTAPHFPVQAPAEDVARYREKYKKGWDALRVERAGRQKASGLLDGSLSAVEREVGPPYPFPAALEKLGPNELNRPLAWDSLSQAQRDFQSAKMAVHAAMVDRLDRELGRVVAQIKAMGALEDTLILFMSDNGASAEIMVRGDGHDPEAPPGSGRTFLSIGPGWSSLGNTPFRRHKTWVHEGGIATPLIVHWPKGIAARGEFRREPAHLIDLVPTLLEAAGAPPSTAKSDASPAFPGKSLLPVFAKDSPVGRESLWWLHEGNRAIRKGDWKAVATKNGAWELYDLKSDRTESNNLAKVDPERLQSLTAEWERTTADFADLAARNPAPAPATPRKKAAR